MLLVADATSSRADMGEMFTILPGPAVAFVLPIGRSVAELKRKLTLRGHLERAGGDRGQDLLDARGSQRDRGAAERGARRRDVVDDEHRDGRQRSGTRETGRAHTLGAAPTSLRRAASRQQPGARELEAAGERPGQDLGLVVPARPAPPPGRGDPGRDVTDTGAARQRLDERVREPLEQGVCTAELGGRDQGAERLRIRERFVPGVDATRRAQRAGASERPGA